MGRAQLSLSVVEAGVGALLVLAVTTGFALGPPAPDAGDPQLEAYAEDVATVLADAPPRHRGSTRLAEVASSERTFERERAALDRRIDRLLPDSLLYRLDTPHGSVGYRPPAGVALGVATVVTPHGPVSIRVWYV